MNITCIGDSITRGLQPYLPPHTDLDVDENWIYKLLGRLIVGTTPTVEYAWTPFSTSDPNVIHYKLTAGDVTMWGAGIGGNTTTQMLARFSTDVLGHSTDHCIIAGGVNDLAGSVPVATIESNIAAMVDLCIANGIVPHLATLCPWNNGTTAQKNNLDTLNAWIVSYGTSNGVDVVDWYTSLAPDANRNSAYLLDGVHPGPAGHTLMADAFDLTEIVIGSGTAAATSTTSGSGYASTLVDAVLTLTASEVPALTFDAVLTLLSGTPPQVYIGPMRGSMTATAALRGGRMTASSPRLRRS